jgi:hypothetical protein
MLMTSLRLPVLGASLLALGSLAVAVLPAARAQAKDNGLETAWTAAGSYMCVATGAKGTIYAVQHPSNALQEVSRCTMLDESGKPVRTFDLFIHRGGTMHVVRRPGAEEGLLTFDSGSSVVMSKADGTKIWELKDVAGIDDARPADLDGDSVDEVIVGYNNSIGLHVFTADGKRLWKRTDPGTVWHVAAGDLDGDGKQEVLTTSIQGKVHVTDAAGKAVRDLDPGVYANMVRSAPARAMAGGAGRARPRGRRSGAPARAMAGAKGDIVLAGGTTNRGLALTALTGDGKIHWTVSLEGDESRFGSLEVSPDGRWAGVAIPFGQIYVVDIAQGQVVARTVEYFKYQQVAWTTSDQGKASGPLLLVTTGVGVKAYRVRPTGGSRGGNRR